MNRLLQRYAHNVIVDEILYWSTNRREIGRVIPAPMDSNGARVIIEFRDRSTQSIQIQQGVFQEAWDEARIVLETATNIPGDFRRLTDAELDAIEPARRLFAEENTSRLEQQVAQDLAQSMIEIDAIFKDGLYDIFLNETGVQIKEPSDSLKAKIAYAIKH
jgi:hypothetical protein